MTDRITISTFDVVDGKVRAGDVVQLVHANGDRIGPRRVTSVAQGGGGHSLLVTRVGDVDPTAAGARRGRYLERLLAAGRSLTTIQRGVPIGALDGDTP
jgi:hypothetical protein